MWISPDGQYPNHIDYILCSQRWRSSIQSAKSRLGADCGSDDQTRIEKFRLKLKEVRKTTGKQWNSTLFQEEKERARGAIWEPQVTHMDGQIVALAIEILLYLAKVWGREGRLDQW